MERGDCEESIEKRQSNEFEALEAIYAGDLRDLRKQSVWNLWTPLDLSITLIPQQGSFGTQDFHVKVDLHIMCDKEYPNSVPKISLENPKGLADVLLVGLKEKLDEMANDLKGEEMILQLSLHVQEFLHKHNKPASKSFHEEMLQQQKEREEKEKLEKQIEQDKKNQQILKEMKQREELLKAEARIRRNERNRINSEDEDGSDTITRRKSNSSMEYIDDTLCQHEKTELLQFGFRSIRRGKCLGHSSDPVYSTFCGFDMQSGELVCVIEWYFQQVEDMPKFRKQINSIEQELNYLKTLNHPNLAKYLCIEHQMNRNNATIYVLHEFMFGSCLSTFLNQNGKVGIDFLKRIARGVLTALDYLHRNNVVHRDIKVTSVYLSDDNVKVMNCSIHRRLADLSSRSRKNYGKKTDILNFGSMILSLLRGFPVSVTDMEIPSKTRKDLYDFLTRCLVTEETVRSSATQLLGHSLFHESVQLPSNAVPEERERIVPPELNPDDLCLLSHSVVNSLARINTEFEIIEVLGKGAYGDVIKVKNKLDGGTYAIKRIKLIPKNKSIRKEILREVKLLSSVNHENIVRYYNSWIEKTTANKVDSPDNSRELSKEKVGVTGDPDEKITESKNVFKMNVSLMYDSKSDANMQSSSEEESSDEDEVPIPPEEESEYVVFENGSQEPLKSTHSANASENAKEDSEEVVKFELLYLQMEFCEKSTLRTAIDENLYRDKQRSQRLFREIVEGLAHIHRHHMIHRDLKPVNIFLDSEDQIKIGDFGLATTSINKQNELSRSKSPLGNLNEAHIDESKTGLIGTALYVAPEVNVSKRAVYNEKVDSYSLGIILFEMCYKPLPTAMERIHVLRNLRSEEIIFPDDSGEILSENEITLIRWLLTHDVSKRPTSQELLQSSLMPSQLVKEKEFQDLLNVTIGHPSYKNYKYLLTACFNQEMILSTDVSYDKVPLPPNFTHQLQLRKFVRKACVKIFEQHGGQNWNTSLLMPRSKFYEDVNVKVMTPSGGVVSLPYDLRVPFARHVAWNEISNLRRYSIERVFRESKVPTMQPRELYECAFDIVTPNQGSLMADAEILCIVCRILKELPVIKDMRFLIKINHTQLVTAILLHCGIKDGYDKVNSTLHNFSEGKIHKPNMRDFFISLELPDSTINLLMDLFGSNIELSRLDGIFRMITKNKSSKESVLAKEALRDLEVIIRNAEAFGVEFNIVISPSLVFNVPEYSGMIFQFVYELKKKSRLKKKIEEKVAAGGRYDSMIAFYRSMLGQVHLLNKDVKQSAVGVSISLDKLVHVLQKEQSENLPKMDDLEAVVCSIGTKQMILEKTRILKNLWRANIKCSLIENTTLEEIQDLHNELKVPHFIMLADNEPGVVTIRSWTKENFQDDKFTISEVADGMQLIIKNLNDSWGGQENIPPSVLARSDSKMNNTEDSIKDILIIAAPDKKLPPSTRKRYETQIKSKMESFFEKISGSVVVLGVFVDRNVIKKLAAFLEFESKTHFQQSVRCVSEIHSKGRAYLDEICDEIYKQKTNAKYENPTIVVFGLTENYYNVIF